ncbi:MAG: cell division protein SepF [Acidimicrobiales bacterium]
MSSMWRKAMLYLGLGPDEEYEYDDSGYDAVYEGNDMGAAPAVASQRHFTTSEPAMPPTSVGSVRPLTREPYQPGGSVTFTTGSGNEARSSGTVRPMAAPIHIKPHTVSPDSFNEVQQIADRFIAGTPVIMNLQGVDRDLSRRFVDFASGMCYGLSGQMERVTNQVYLLTPSNVEVSAEDRRNLQERNP